MNISNKSSVVVGSQQGSADILAWERLPGESPRWFARFNAYRLLGSSRSIDGAWRQEQRTKTNKNGRAPDSWHKASKRFEWRERALTWDVADAERVGQEVLEERARRLRRAIHHRRRREAYLDGLERTLRQHVENVVNKMNPAKNGRDIEWYEARVQAHFNFIERMMRLGQAEYAAEERILVEVANRQQQMVESPSVVLTDQRVAATMELGVAATTRPLLNPAVKRTTNSPQSPAPSVCALPTRIGFSTRQPRRP